MMRESGPMVPAPDTARFERDDYALPILGICAPCLASVSNSAAYNARVGSLNTGLARDVQGCRVITPAGRSMLWEYGADLPSDPMFIADMARLFGESATFTDGVNAPLPMYAVTTVGGTLVCPYHAVAALGSRKA